MCRSAAIGLTPDGGDARVRTDRRVPPARTLPGARCGNTSGEASRISAQLIAATTAAGRRVHAPWAIAEATHKLQSANQDVTEIVEVPGRGHSITINSGWKD